MKTVVIASTNPVKVEVAKRAFAAVFPNEEFSFIEIKSESGVPDQPMDEETRKGALNRLRYIQKKHPDADFWISQEGGLHTDGDALFNQACIAVSDKNGFIAESKTAQFFLPKQLMRYIKDGVGAIGHLTDGIINRTEYYLQAAVIALSELKHKEWY